MVGSLLVLVDRCTIRYLMQHEILEGQSVGVRDSFSLFDSCVFFSLPPM